MELKIKTNKRHLAVKAIIGTIHQTLARRSFTETAECLVERDNLKTLLLTRIFSISALLPQLAALAIIVATDS